MASLSLVRLVLGCWAGWPVSGFAMYILLKPEREMLIKFPHAAHWAASCKTWRLFLKLHEMENVLYNMARTPQLWCSEQDHQGYSALLGAGAWWVGKRTRISHQLGSWFLPLCSPVELTKVSACTLGKILINGGGGRMCVSSLVL